MSKQPYQLVAFRCPVSTKEKIKQAAASDHRSSANWLLSLIESHLGIPSTYTRKQYTRQQHTRRQPRNAPSSIIRTRSKRTINQEVL